MKKILKNFAESLISRDQMKKIKGGCEAGCRSKKCTAYGDASGEKSCTSTGSGTVSDLCVYECPVLGSDCG